MKTDRRVLIAIGVVVLAGQAWAAELNALGDLKVVSTGEGAQVVVSGTRAPTFTVFRLSDPDRLVVDLSSADAAAIKGHHDGAGPIIGVVTSQFSDERASVARVLVALGSVSRYDVRADGNRVLISVDGAAAARPAETSAVTPVDKPETVAAPEPAGVASPTKTLAAAPQVEPSVEPKPGQENVVNSQVDERPVKHPARAITRLSYDHSTLRVTTDGEVAKYELLELSDPPRLALDVYGVGLTARVPRIISPRVQNLRAGAHADKVRLVLDVEGTMPGYRVVRQGRALELRLGEPTAQPVEVASAGGEEGEIELDGQSVRLAETSPVEVKPEPAALPGRVVDIKDIAFTESSAGGRVEFKLSGGALWKVERPDPRSAVLTFTGVRLPRRLERSLDTSALGTPVKMVSAFSVPGSDGRVRVVVSADSELDETVTRSSEGLSWRLTAREAKTEQVAVSLRAAGFTAEAPRYAAEGAPRRPRYTGKRVSFEFKDIDIHNLLRVIAEVSKKNVVVADDVSGKVTIRLRNVPWDQALDLILRSKGLGKEELGNIIRVAPLKTLEEEAKLREERRKSEIRQEPLVVKLIPVNYATASNMQDRVKDVLSERGSVTVDGRTNVLIVRDIASYMGRIQSLVQSLDTPTPQVLIESRIVEANTNFTRHIGVQWGGGAQMAPGTGNPTGLIFPNTVSVRGGAGQSANEGTSSTPNFAVNLPAPAGLGSGGALGFVFGSVGGALELNLRLSALENQGSVKTISAPKITTLDNNTARISQGVSIPFSQVSSAGVNTSFVEARLALEVTPHITQDGSILMSIKAENNQPDPSSTGANGQPAISRKEAQTQVLVKDGDTTVIGGIYVRRGATSQNAVPFLSKIPILGFFFRDERESDARQELLIFITPRIINRQAMVQSL